MLYLIGLGLSEKGISLEGLEAVKKCKKVYLEGYTVDFPYEISTLEEIIEKKAEVLKRGEVESERLIKEAKKENVALLVYGCPLFATTHISLLMESEKAKVKTQIIYSASVFDAIAQTGLELYKFGKISSMPKWQKSYTPDSFLDYVLQNKSIGAHSVILIDIGLDISDALNEFEVSIKNKKMKVDKIAICSLLGTEKAKILYGTIENLKKKANQIKLPYCFVIPGEMHFIEREALERFLI